MIIFGFLMAAISYYSKSANVILAAIAIIPFAYAVLADTQNRPGKDT